MTQAEVLAALRRTSLFAGADDAQLRPLTDRAFTRRLAAGQILFTEGEPSEHPSSSGRAGSGSWRPRRTGTS